MYFVLALWHHYKKQEGRMKKLFALLLVLAGIPLISADEPTGVVMEKASLWTVIKPSAVSDVTTVDSEVGESFVITNRGYLESLFDYGTFVLEGDITPQVGNPPYIDNQVIYFSGVGEKGGLPSETPSYEPQGSCFKVQMVQGTLYLQYVDPVQGDRMIKAVQLGAGGVPANWNTFAAPGTFHFRLTVDCGTQRMKFEVQKRFQTPDEGLVTLLEYENTEADGFPPFECGRVGVFNRNRTAGQDFVCNVTGLTVDHEVTLDPPPAGGPQLPEGF
jgi:hypothetical protein